MMVKLSCICDACCSRVTAQNERVTLWSCDRCGQFACIEMLVMRAGGRWCTRCEDASHPTEPA